MDEEKNELQELLDELEELYRTPPQMGAMKNVADSLDDEATVVVPENWTLH